MNDESTDGGYPPTVIMRTNPDTGIRRFAALVMRLGSPVVELLVRRGAAVEVHCWGRRGDGGHVCEVLGIEPRDFGAAGPAGRSLKRTKG
jgi:hypothetical protein